MSTDTQIRTRIDIRRVFENFQADLRMLAVRTQAMELDHAEKCGDDVCLMAQAGCLDHVHIQLYDSYGNLVRVHHYSVEEVMSSSSSRPGENRWPRLPNGRLRVVVTPFDSRRLEGLKERLKLSWSDSHLSTDYSDMRRSGAKLYASNGYGLRRDTFVN